MKITQYTIKARDFFPELSEAEKYTNDLIVNFANELRRARKALNISQSELSRRCNVAQPQMCRWESAEENVRLSTIAKIAVALGVKVDIHFRVGNNSTKEELIERLMVTRQVMRNPQTIDDTIEYLKSIKE